MDQMALRRIRRWEHRLVTPLMRLATTLGNATSWLLLGAVFFFWSETTRRYFWPIAAAALGATAMAHLIKRMIRRTRPQSDHIGSEALAAHPDQYSFPSGHTTTAFSVAAVLLGEPLPIVLLAYGFASWVGYSRLYLGAHFPLDVLMGALIGTSVGYSFRFLWGA
jgi:undecaprenyl-diphosphatase